MITWKLQLSINNSDIIDITAILFWNCSIYRLLVFTFPAKLSKHRSWST